MAAHIIDELITILTLNAEPYRKAEKTVEQETARTYRKQQERARGTERTNKDQQRRLKDVAQGAKAFAVQVAGAVGIVTGLGVAVTGVLSGLLNFDTGLRRQTVGTNLSNRQMQAWSATARRMGADASAGAEAIAALAKEREQFHLGVPAPTLAALSRFGINVDTDRPLEDILADAQSRYRAAPEGQQRQMEASLSASGVSADLIVMIKSEIDAREAYATSFRQAREEDAKASAALADALESVRAAGIKSAGIMASVLQPAIEAGAEKLIEWSEKLAEFTEDLMLAGGGLQGFQQTLDKHVPWLGSLLEGFGMTIDVLRGTFDLLVGAALALGDIQFKVIDKLLGWLNVVRAPWGDKGLVADLRDRWQALTGSNEHQSALQRAVLWFDEAMRDGVRAARDVRADAERRDGSGTPAAPAARPAASPEAEAAFSRNLERVEPPQPKPKGGAVSVQELMTQLTVGGLTVPQAAAVVANLQGESSLRPSAVNHEGGGTGARGLAQWRGPRTQAFMERYGVTPDKAPWQQQIEFMLTDPYERGLLDKSFKRGGDSAERLGVAISEIYEAHGKPMEDARRGRVAARLAGESQVSGREPASNGQNGTSISIQTLNVQANDPRQMSEGLQRLSATQPFNTVVR